MNIVIFSDQNFSIFTFFANYIAKFYLFLFYNMPPGRRATFAKSCTQYLKGHQKVLVKNREAGNSFSGEFSEAVGFFTPSDLEI